MLHAIINTASHKILFTMCYLRAAQSATVHVSLTLQNQNNPANI